MNNQQNDVTDVTDVIGADISEVCDDMLNSFLSLCEKAEGV